MRARDRRRISSGFTVGSAIAEFTRELKLLGLEEAGGDVRRLLAAVLDSSSADLLRAPERQLSPAQAATLSGYVERRRSREPVSRILGQREFYGRCFTISPATLDPRPDSETVVATTLEVVREERWDQALIRVLDVGTGSGCLLLTLLYELPHATGLGTDIREAALAVAAVNADNLGLRERATWQVADGLERVCGSFHILVANPPYVRTRDIEALSAEVRGFDPIEALDGGPDGLDIYRRIAKMIAMTVPDGWIVFEVGYDQADAVVEILVSEVPAIDTAGIRIRPDVAGIRRCVAARTRG